MEARHGCAIYDGGPAFPDPGRAQSEKQREKLAGFGMSLRDYFAASAAIGLLHDRKEYTGDEIAAYSYGLADALLRVRKGIAKAEGK